MCHALLAESMLRQALLKTKAAGIQLEHAHNQGAGCCQYNRHGAYQTLACTAEAGLLLHPAAKDLLSSVAVLSSAAVHSTQERPQAALANSVSLLAYI